MLISDFREACETLARFASVRENAPVPSDRVYIQQLGGLLKLVAGTDDRTVVVSCGEHDEPDFRALVSSRLLLSAGKALKGKGIVAISKADDGVLLHTSTGGSVSLPNVGSSVPQYVRQEQPIHTVELPTGFWPDAVKRLTASAEKAGSYSQVTCEVSSGRLSLRATDTHMFSERVIQLTNVLGEDFHLALDLDFVNALRGIEGGSVVDFSLDRITVRDGRFTATHKPLSLPPVPAFRPIEEADTAAVTDRKGLIEMVKATAPHDTANRVVLSLSSDSITAAPWGKSGSMTLPARVTGKGGRIGVTADYLISLLNAMPTKTVELAFASDVLSPVRLTGESDPLWHHLLAPVAL